ncbi:MAG: hypothetical protein HY330_05330 [Chloroflexi bacterium]|nr:hypothetical protein [Chloroflexota bacterium]
MPAIPARTMAAITAAVQLYLEEEQRPAHHPPPRPRTAAAAWADYGRSELMRQRTAWQLRLAR